MLNHQSRWPTSCSRRCLKFFALRRIWYDTMFLIFFLRKKQFRIRKKSLSIWLKTLNELLNWYYIKTKWLFSSKLIFAFATSELSKNSFLTQQLERKISSPLLFSLKIAQLSYFWPAKEVTLGLDLRPTTLSKNAIEITVCDDDISGGQETACGFFLRCLSAAV